MTGRTACSRLRLGPRAEALSAAISYDPDVGFAIGHLDRIHADVEEFTDRLVEEILQPKFGGPVPAGASANPSFRL